MKREPLSENILKQFNDSALADYDISEFATYLADQKNLNIFALGFLGQYAAEKFGRNRWRKMLLTTDFNPHMLILAS